MQTDRILAAAEQQSICFRWMNNIWKNKSPLSAFLEAYPEGDEVSFVLICLPVPLEAFVKII